MAAGRSVYSWDIVVKKIEGKIILDKRDRSTVDFLSVNETSTEPPSMGAEKDGGKMDDDVNSPPKLAREAARINQNYNEALISRANGVDLAAENPFCEEEGEEVAGCCYRYVL